jgi:uncharacterized protein (DUF2252 family)
MRDPVDEFMAYNRLFARRSPELLRLKTARMAESAFAFFRGTFHLFARDALDRSWRPPWLLSGDGPEMDLVGDLHSENYGTYKASDGLIHYDVNDFDETTRGRFDFDVYRLAVSHFLAARERGDALADAVLAPLAGLTTYTETVRRLLKKGSTDNWDVNPQKPSHCGPVDRLVESAAAARRPDFIGRLTEAGPAGRRLRRSLHYFNLPDADRAQALRLLADLLKRKTEPPPTRDYYRAEDVCGRVSGIGSMGRYRYVVLIAGKGSSEARNVLLEFKESRPSAYDVGRGRDLGAEALVRRAERVAAVQRQSQAVSSNRLGFAVDGGLSFQVRELGPADSRIDARALKAPAQWAEAARLQAAILARIHARAALREVGPVNPLAELADADDFCQRLLSLALSYAHQVQRDYQRFVGARAQLDDVAEWAGVG